MPILFRRGFRRGGWGGGGGGGGADWTRKVAETGKADALAVGEVCKALISLERRSIPLNQQNGDSQEVRAKIQQAIRSREVFRTIGKGRKLQCYAHVSRSSGLAKSILQCIVKDGRRQGRHKKRWEDNIREWTGLEFAKSKRAVEDR